MSDASPGPGWWLASDGRWYPPETHPDARPPGPAPGTAGPFASVPYGAGPGAYGVPVTGAAGNDQMAVWSLVLGIAGVPLSCCCYIGVPMLIAAIPLGIVSRNRIRASNGALEGEGMALAGAIVGAVGLAVVVALFLLNMAVSISDWTVG